MSVKSTLPTAWFDQRSLIGTVCANGVRDEKSKTYALLSVANPTTFRFTHLLSEATRTQKGAKDRHVV